MKHFILSALVSLLTSPLLVADAGILLPRDKQQPDANVLSLEEMEITVRIDNGDARVFVKQIFANQTGGIEEGNYVFALQVMLRSRTSPPGMAPRVSRP